MPQLKVDSLAPLNSVNYNYFVTRLIEVVPYDPKWARRYRLEADKIAAVLKTELVQIQHIGSTAVNKILAKPIIDILAEVRGIEALDARNEEMLALGYRAMGEYGIKARRFFVKGTEESRICHLHIYQSGNPRIAEHLYFRDYLIANPKEAKQYSDLKRSLARKHPHDIDKYMDGKNSFIKDIINKANL